MIEVVAPSDFLADGNQPDARRCGYLIARMQNGFLPRMLDVNFSFNYGDSRAFGAGVHGEDRARDGYGAIRSADVQVTCVTMCGLHDNAALIEMNGGVAAIRADGQFRALIHFHFGAVEESHCRMGIGGRADEFTLGDFVAQLQRLLTGRANAVSEACDGVDARAVARRAIDVPVASGPNQRNQDGQ